jgi:hypothetical protein
MPSPLRYVLPYLALGPPGAYEGILDCEVLQAYLWEILLRGENLPSYAPGCGSERAAGRVHGCQNGASGRAFWLIARDLALQPQFSIPKSLTCSVNNLMVSA